MRRKSIQQEPQSAQQDPMQMLAGLMGLLMQMGEYEMKQGADQRQANAQGFEQDATNRQISLAQQKQQFEQEKFPVLTENNQTDQVLRLLTSGAGPGVNIDLANQQFKESGLGALFNGFSNQGFGQVKKPLKNPTPNSGALTRIRQETGM